MLAGSFGLRAVRGHVKDQGDRLKWIRSWSVWLDR